MSAGRPVGQLTDAELEAQGKQAHDTRTWVFLHGSAEQFASHTVRMLAPEQEYLRRQADPPLVLTEGEDRVLTDADRARAGAG